MEFMDYFNIGMGAVLIVIGWLCYYFPNMINPYGGLSPERKELVDIDGLKKSVALIMTVAGVLLIGVALLSVFKVIDEMVSAYAMMAVVIAMLIPLFIAMRKYNGFGRDENGQRASVFNVPSKAVWVSMGLTAVFIIAIFSFSNQAPKIQVGKEEISISGMYGRHIPTSEVVSVELLEEMPPVQMRVNGSSTGKYNKGHFLLKNGEKCVMNIRRKAPYIELRTTENLYYLNGASEEETLRLYEQLKSLNP